MEDAGSMEKKVHLVLALHSHQPVGNFDGVFEEAFQKAYLPFLKVLKSHPKIPVALHWSGVLFEWVRKHHPEAFTLLETLSRRGQVEMLGGGFYEPILVMLPKRDRLGQLQMHREYVKRHFGLEVRGAWLTERVWEQALVSDLAQAGFEYVPVDDSHFKYAGISPVGMGYYVTEDEGKMLAVFPAQEFLRYSIPFHSPEETIEFLLQNATESSDRLLVYADDGEKFGLWPGTHKHVYLDGWLERFLRLLEANESQIHLATFSWALENLKPLGRAYLPDASYREMMEWALPVGAHLEQMELEERLKGAGLFDRARYFLKGTFWRSFLAKYPESNEMHAKMMLVSQKVDGLDKKSHAYRKALDELYQGQCNCAYWHGIFGGLYLPHLRSAVYEHLIASEVMAESQFLPRNHLCAEKKDINFDGHDEVIVSNEHLNIYLKPHYGGHIWELDLKEAKVNLLMTLARREEAYHKRLLESAKAKEPSVASIHEQIVFKEENLEKKLFYDLHKRESAVDHFVLPGTTVEALATCRYQERGDFVDGPYECELKETPSAIQAHLTRSGRVLGEGESHEVRVEKVVRVRQGSREISFVYRVINLSPQPLETTFAIEFNFAMLAGRAHDRYYVLGKGGENSGPLVTVLDTKSDLVGIRDEYRGVGLALHFEKPTSIWTFPVETVSTSEAGFEKIYQSSAIVPHWEWRLLPRRARGVKFSLALDVWK